MNDSKVILSDREWKEFFRKIKGNLSEPFRLLKVAANTYGFADIINHFKQETGERGAWAKRKKSTQRSYASKGKKDRRYSPSNKLLQLTGQLRNSLLPGEGKITKKGHFGALMFSTSRVGIYHQKGTSKMKKRDFMWLSGRATQRMSDLILSLAMRGA